MLAKHVQKHVKLAPPKAKAKQEWNIPQNFASLVLLLATHWLRRVKPMQTLRRFAKNAKRLAMLVQLNVQNIQK